MSSRFCLEVAGPFACFTRPEMKVERVSYDVITPSAARAVFESILWKPAIRWRVQRIEVLRPIRFIKPWVPVLESWGSMLKMIGYSAQATFCATWATACTLS